MNEAEVWDQFQRKIDRARPALDGCVPVALICLPVETNATGDLLVMIKSPEAHPRMLWDAEFPVAERGPMMARLSESYLSGRAMVDPKAKAEEESAG